MSHAPSSLTAPAKKVVAPTSTQQSGTLSGLSDGQQLTFNQEGGFRSQAYHPTLTSGVTIGVGYDMRERSHATINAELIAAGVDRTTASCLSTAAGITGKAADEWVTRNSSLTMTVAQGKSLFLSTYAAKANYAQHLATKPDVTAKYGVADWGKLNQAIKDVLVDMAFRGDYTGTVRETLQKDVVKNDLAAFTKDMSNKGIFPPNLSKWRFNARVEFLKQN